MNSKRLRNTSRLLLFISLLFIFCCGSSENEPSPLRLAYLQSDLHHLPAFVALEKGFYREEGVTVEVSGIFKAGPEMMSGFAAGSLDVGYVGLAPALVAVANKTARIKVLSQVNKNGSALVVRKDAPYRSISDLNETVIAIPGHATIQDFLIRKALIDAGVESNGPTIITIKPPEMLAVLTSAQIDAFIAWEPYPSLAITRDTGKIFRSSKDIWPDHPCCVLIVSTEFMKKNPAQVAALRKAHLKSIAYIENNPQDAITIGVTFTGMEKRAVELALQNIDYDHSITTSQALEYIDFLNKLGYTTITQPQSFFQSLTIN
jgi:NitT/TauT family transport system substrate-binding protein